jgi:hypothetical protein
VQVAHERHDHHPARLTVLAAAAALLVAAPSATAAAPRFWALPSPLAPLSSSPPLGTGALASGEGRPHRVFAATRVRVAIDQAGTPFAVRAVQRLDVRRIGDYSFQIGAPVLDVRAAAGSDASPGLRSGAYLWQGFNPGRRTLAAQVELDPRAAAGSLPLRVEVAADRVTLHNVTTLTVPTFAADARVPPLLAYLASLRRSVSAGVLPSGGGAVVTSALEPVRVRVDAPLLVTGTVGARRIDLVLDGSVSYPRGAVHLEVRPQPPRALLTPGPGESGRRLLLRATRATLSLARLHQYQAYLGNPDPGGTSQTTYVYVSGRRADVPQTAVPKSEGAGRVRTVLVAIGSLAAVALAAFAWARS